MPLIAIIFLALLPIYNYLSKPLFPQRKKKSEKGLDVYKLSNNILVVLTAIAVLGVGCYWCIVINQTITASGEAACSLVLTVDRLKLPRNSLNQLKGGLFLQSSLVYNLQLELEKWKNFDKTNIQASAKSSNLKTFSSQYKTSLKSYFETFLKNEKKLKGCKTYEKKDYFFDLQSDMIVSFLNEANKNETEKFEKIAIDLEKALIESFISIDTIEKTEKLKNELNLIFERIKDIPYKITVFMEKILKSLNSDTTRFYMSLLLYLLTFFVVTLMLVYLVIMVLTYIGFCKNKCGNSSIFVGFFCSLSMLISITSMISLSLSAIIVNSCHHFRLGLENKNILKELAPQGLTRYSEACLAADSTNDLTKLADGDFEELKKGINGLKNIGDYYLFWDATALIGDNFNTINRFEAELDDRINFKTLFKLGKESEESPEVATAQLQQLIDNHGIFDLLVFSDTECHNKNGIAFEASQSSEYRPTTASSLKKYCVEFPKTNAGARYPSTTKAKRILTNSVSKLNKNIQNFYENLQSTESDLENRYQSLRSCTYDFLKLANEMKTDYINGIKSTGNKYYEEFGSKTIAFFALREIFEVSSNYFRIFKENGRLEILSCGESHRVVSEAASEFCSTEGFGYKFAQQSFILSILGVLFSILTVCIWFQLRFFIRDLEPLPEHYRGDTELSQPGFTSDLML